MKMDHEGGNQLPMKRQRKTGTYAYGLISAIFIAICAAVGVLCFQYYNRLQSTIREESSGYLLEVSRRIGTNINRIINDNYAVLDTMASVLRSDNVNSFDDVKPVVEAQKSYWNYKDIMLIDSSGRAYDSNGREVSLTSDIYLQNAVVSKQASMSTSQMVGNEEAVVFAIPLDNMMIDGKTMVALASSYDPAVFDQVLSMTAFEGKAFSHIISKDGTIIIRSTAQESLKMGYNVLTSLSVADWESGKSVDTIKDDMAENRVGQVEFSLDGQENYMVYTPIDPEDWYLLTFVPVKVVNAKSDLLLKITLMLCGSITLIFSGMITFLLYSSYRNKTKLERVAYVDEVTGGNTIQRFYGLAKEALSKAGHPTYAMVYTNFEKFKVLNEQLGRNVCDSILEAFYKCVSENLKEGECIGRQSADNFCVLVKYDEEEDILKRFEQWYRNGEAYVMSNKPIWGLPIAEFGIMVIDDDTVPFPQMIDRAKLALRKSSHSINSHVKYAVYDDELRRSLFREKQLEDMMESALANHEFQVYLQPKYKVDDETIGGAEALTRWVSVAEGMIYPDEFIPLFEKNGFIVRLDLWVFEQVCSKLRQWLDAGAKPVKISINCSRVHLRDPEFLKEYKRISKEYNIPYGLLEIELTESVVMEDAEQLGRTIDQIHEAGFGCSMDDFGSGYSSLNLIQSIPVDTLKLDKIFFRNKDEERVESVVGGIVTMANALCMETVAEGVEYREQVEMLRKIGCNYIQGYVFAKPMPITAFEQLLFGKEVK